MKKYTIEVFGRGAEVFIHKIDEEQKKVLQEMDVEDGDKSVDWDKINEILKVDSWDYSDETYSGAYSSPTSCHIVVYDDEDKIVWQSDDDSEIEPKDDEDYNIIEKNDVLVIEHSVKGEFSTYILETEKFEEDKLGIILTDINEAVELVTGLTYDGQKLERDEWGDNWSKGAFFYIF